jgi:Protein of unknown function (DUF2829)
MTHVFEGPTEGPQSEYAAESPAVPMPAHGIGWAIWAMRGGSRVRRAGWNGRGMWLTLISGAQWDLPRDLDLTLSDPGGGNIKDGYAYRGPFVALRAADGMLVPWLCSQTDLLATDWEMVE